MTAQRYKTQSCGWILFTLLTSSSSVSSSQTIVGTCALTRSWNKDTASVPHRLVMTSRTQTIRDKNVLQKYKKLCCDFPLSCVLSFVDEIKALEILLELVPFISVIANTESYLFEFFHNYQNTKLTDLAITSYLDFPILNLLQSLINLVEYAT